MIVTMSKKKNPQAAPEPSPEPRKKRKMIGVPKRLHKLLTDLADKNSRPVTWQLRRMIEDEAKREGIPVPPPGADEDE